MTTRQFKVAAAIMLAMSVSLTGMDMLAGGCGGGNGGGNGGGGGGGGGTCNGTGQGQGGGTGVCKGAVTLTSLLNSLPVEAVSQAEIDGLKLMREEEKMSGDLYNLLAPTAGVPAFKNIPKAEKTHFDAVKILLDRYAIPDPAQATAGVFTNPVLQADYDALAAAGKASRLAALTSALTVEELDLADLAAQIAASDSQDVKTLYQNLAMGSRNHLRAFYKVLLRNKGSYVPTHLTQAQFDAIINSRDEKGVVDANGNKVLLR